MNVDRLKHLSEYLRNLPDDGDVGFNMSEWWLDKDDDYRCVRPVDYRGHLCNTAACVAGHTVYLFSGDAARTIRIEEAARELLGLFPDQANCLFMPYDEHLDTITPHDAANAIDRLLQGVALPDLWGE
ncbi:MAG: hypothetical protein MN733_01110 [Nitrososphaera sp.]|nr:hypothetical protein [Nitrososphaera sp.]